MRTTPCPTCAGSHAAGLRRCRDCGASLPDRYGRRWTLPDEERCPECGQPDSVGDCTHARLSATDVATLGGEGSEL